jgi:subtilisin family serine protease
VRALHRTLRLGLALIGLAAAAVASPTTPWQLKVDPEVLSASAGGPVEVLLVLGEQADLAPAAGLDDKQAKGRFVFETLRAKAEPSQRGLLAALVARGVEHRPFWIANFVWARLGAGDLADLAARPEVAAVEANPRFHVPEPQEAYPLSPGAIQAVEWGIAKIRADQVWSLLGVTGAGAVVGGQDTGYQWDHPALKGKYRGWDGTTADHDYNWHDAIHENNPNTAPGNPCGFDLLAPCDDNGHGTHTLGTMVGDDGIGNQVGVAPGAKWIACRNMESGWGTPATYAECLQWFVAPTDLSGGNPDPARAPHVVNNSWGCPPNEGCAAPDVLRVAVENLRAAGIVVIASAGNSGASCGSVSDPPAIYDASLTVANTDSSDAAAGDSSRGPVTVDGSNRLKPDLAAPGSSIRSTYPPSSYVMLSGTSMAGPHVAGVVALMISAEPRLAGRVDAIERILRDTAAPRTSTQTCGAFPGASVPNAVFGAGRLDALAAVGRAIAFVDLFADGFEGGSLAAWTP